MDIELILYIIFLAIVLLTRLLKGKKENVPPAQQEQTMHDVPHEQPHRRPTFEELLREFTSEREVEEPEPEKKAGREYVEAVDIRDDSETEEVYRRSVKEARNLKTLDEQVDLDAPIPRLKSFEKTETVEESDITRDIFESLQDAEGAKKAIILSEIINRRY